MKKESEKSKFDFYRFNFNPDVRPDPNDLVGVSDYIAHKNKEYYEKGITGFYDKLKYVVEFAKSSGKKLLDAGCGNGIFMRELIKNGHDVFGIDHSNICSTMLLTDVPHEKIDITEYCSTTEEKFDGVYCVDVLEHVPYKDIDEMLSVMTNVSNVFLFGIANHPDVQFGYELHKITQNKDWWIDKLSEYFSEVEYVASLFIGQFFFIKCRV